MKTNGNSDSGEQGNGDQARKCAPFHTSSAFGVVNYSSLPATEDIVTIAATGLSGCIWQAFSEGNAVETAVSTKINKNENRDRGERESNATPIPILARDKPATFQTPHCTPSGLLNATMSVLPRVPGPLTATLLLGKSSDIRAVLAAKARVGPAACRQAAIPLTRNSLSHHAS